MDCFVAEPVIGHAFATVAGEVAFTDLMSASGHQDHTASPAASGAFVEAPSASTAFRPAFVSIATGPSVRQDGRIRRDDLPDAKAEYFSRRDRTGEITLIALAFLSFCRPPDMAGARYDNASGLPADQWRSRRSARRRFDVSRGGHGTISGLVNWAAVDQEI